MLEETHEASGRRCSSKRMVDTVGRYFDEVLNQGRLELLDALMSPEVVLLSPARLERIRGREGVRRFVTGVRTGAPHVRFTVERRLVQGNQVAARWHIDGMCEGLEVFVFDGDRVAELRVSESTLGLMAGSASSVSEAARPGQPGLRAHPCLSFTRDHHSSVFQGL